MSTSVFEIHEKKQELLALIVDKTGIIGAEVAKKLQQSLLTVLVSEKKPETNTNIVAIPFQKTMPQIPDGSYSHIFFVWDGDRETLELVTPLLEKATQNQAMFLFVSYYHVYQQEYVEKISVYDKAFFVLTGDVFGYLDSILPLDRVLRETRKTKKMILDNIGLTPVYPALFADTVDGLMHVAFGTVREKVQLLFPKAPVTELSLAHLLQKIDPLIAIDFSKENNTSDTFILPEGHSVGPSSLSVLEKLQKTYEEIPVVEEEVAASQKISKQSHTFSQGPRKKKMNWFAFGVYALIVLLLFPVVITAGALFIGRGLLLQGVSSVQKGNLQTAQSAIQAAGVYFSIGQSGESVLDKELSFISKPTLLIAAENQTAQAVAMTQSLSNAVSGIVLMKNVLNGKTIRPESDFSEAINDIKKAQVAFSEMISGGQVPAQYQTQLGIVTDFANLFSRVSDVLPSVVGMDSKKTYLVLFQNNMELRPGGGFIGSYGLLTFDKGKITDFSIHDVYDADGQLKGHVEPPFAIRRYIPLVHWYLRDSNFDPDFTVDGKNAAFFLQQETGQVVDGVIGIDLDVVKGLIASLGKVSVPSYNETVTKDNFFLLTEKHAEKNSFAGSSQKKDFLRALFESIQTSFGNGKSNYGLLAKSFLQNLTEKHLLFSFSDTKVQDPFTTSNLSASLWDPRGIKENIINDFTGINEANIGIDKANYFLKRSVIQQVVMGGDGKITGNIVISYENTSPNYDWPGGVYRNYLRIMLPSGATLTDVNIDGKDQNLIAAITDPKVYEAPGFLAPKGLEIEKTQEQGKVLYGLLVTVPPATTQHVTISYALSQNVPLGNPLINYSLTLFKQAGTENYPYTFSLTYPVTYGVSQSTDGGFVGNGKVTYQMQFGEDKTLDIQLAKK